MTVRSFAQAIEIIQKTQQNVAAIEMPWLNRNCRYYFIKRLQDTRVGEDKKEKIALLLKILQKTQHSNDNMVRL